MWGHTHVSGRLVTVERLVVRRRARSTRLVADPRPEMRHPLPSARRQLRPVRYSPEESGLGITRLRRLAGPAGIPKDSAADRAGLLKANIHAGCELIATNGNPHAGFRGLALPVLRGYITLCADEQLILAGFEAVHLVATVAIGHSGRQPTAFRQLYGGVCKRLARSIIENVTADAALRGGGGWFRRRRFNGALCRPKSLH